MSENYEIWKKKWKKMHFFENVIFGIFWVAKKSKKSNHQKCEKFIKQPYFFIAAFERRALNTIFGSSEPPRKIFFSGHREVNLSKFSFFAKNHWKINVFVIFDILDLQNLHFFIGFSIKMKCHKIPEIKFCIKTNRKLRFLHFL